MKASDTLRAGAAWLDSSPEEWGTRNERICAVRACALAAGVVLAKMIPFALRTQIILYNDYVAADVHDVIVFMRTLADILEGKHVEL